MSKCITVLSLIVLQLWSSSGEIHPDVQRFVSSRSTALKGFHDGYKGENSSRLRDFSEGLDTYKYVQMISDRDVLRRTLGSSMLRNIYIKQTRILLSKKVINLFQQSEQGELIMYTIIHCRSGPPVSSPWLSFEDSFFDILPILSTQISSEPELLLVFVLFY